jgi:lysozyme family protein
MASFDPAFENTLKWEGCYSCDPDDPGGETKWGITKRDHPGLEIAMLTKEQAGEIYRRDYWHFDSIDSQAVANKVFDLAVNCGPKTATRLLQQALVSISRVVAVDGSLGQETLWAANSMPESELLAALRENAKEHYEKLVAHNPKLNKFLHGWLKRAAAA